MALAPRYRPRHAERRTRPMLAIASLLLGMLASGATALNAVSQPNPNLRRGIGHFG